jgi:hypothetical protein
MTRINQTFCTVPWEENHSDPALQALSSSASDHCPIHLTSQQWVTGLHVFKFEAHWPYMPGFSECVQHAWCKPVIQNHNAMMSLHIKMMRTSKALAIWTKRLLPQGKLATTICREIIDRLETSQEVRILLDDEHELIGLLKKRLLGLAAIEKSRACQRARLNWIKKGDVNTWYFHIMSYARKKKNFIAILSNKVQTASSQEDKHRLVFNYYQDHIGSCSHKRYLINFDEIGWTPRPPDHLNLPFTS